MDQNQTNPVVMTDESGSTAMTAKALQSPFQRIALALSGGGFRAAAYSIGTMSYLRQVPYGKDNHNLLDNVVFISSASGGTFANMLYSLYLKKGKAFEDAYHDLLHFMNGQSLLEDVLKTVNNDGAWANGEKTRNFINAFARTYDEKLFGHETFAAYWNTAHPIEVCFNATEFHRGLSFRFQTDGNIASNPMLDEKTGNAYVYFDKTDPDKLKALQAVKLGDIMAASSCFPGGFEPILFPKDFSYPAGNQQPGLDSATLRKALTITPYNKEQPPASDISVGLMDGGIDDNQALFSAMTADERRRKKGQGFDLVMVTDVASYFMETPYTAPKEPVGKWTTQTLSGLMGGIAKKIKSISSILRWTGIIAAITLLAAVVLLITQPGEAWVIAAYVLTGPALLLLVAALYLTHLKNNNPVIDRLQYWLGLTDKQLAGTLHKEVSSVKDFSEDSIALFIKYIRNAPLGTVSQMVTARMSSLLSMAMDINLKQTRRLIFNIFYGNFQEKSPWDNRRVFNVIYELSSFNIQGRMRAFKKAFGELKDKSWYDECYHLLMEGCETLNKVAEDARTMGTTLWFDKKDADDKRMMKVVACGQFTACAKLLEYILITEKKMAAGDPGIKFNEEAIALFKQVKTKVLADWQRFKNEPFFLYEQYAAAQKNQPLTKG